MVNVSPALQSFKLTVTPVDKSAFGFEPGMTFATGLPKTEDTEQVAPSVVLSKTDAFTMVPAGIGSKGWSRLASLNVTPEAVRV